MSANPVPKDRIAQELLARAIQLFLRRDSFFAAIHLAGAAEEIFSRYIEERVSPTGEKVEASGKVSIRFATYLAEPESEAERAQIEKRIYALMHGAKNSVKHKRGVGDNAVDFDPEEEAYDIIDRALATYRQYATGDRWFHIPASDDFERYRTERREARQKTSPASQ